MGLQTFCSDHCSTMFSTFDSCAAVLIWKIELSDIPLHSKITFACFFFIIETQNTLKLPISAWYGHMVIHFTSVINVGHIDTFLRNWISLRYYYQDKDLGLCASYRYETINVSLLG